MLLAQFAPLLSAFAVSEKAIDAADSNGSNNCQIDSKES
jgi:hypothetical protein